LHRVKDRYPAWGSPEDCARFFSCIAEDNFLAHSIREIEKAILRKHSFHYHIFPYLQDRDAPFRAYFRQNSCEIRIQKSELSSIKAVRLRLAHEIGHIVYNIDLLPDDVKREALNSRRLASPEEELFAWRFAYRLIKEKSDQYHDNIYGEFKFKDQELKDAVLALTEDKQEICKELRKLL
jgi:hypothetical protein